MDIANSRSGYTLIGVRNRDIVDASPLKYYILVHIQLLNNGSCDFGSGVSTLNDLTHVDHMRRIAKHEDVPIGQNLEIMRIRQITVSHLKNVYLIAIFIIEMVGNLLVRSRDIPFSRE